MLTANLLHFAIFCTGNVVTAFHKKETREGQECQRQEKDKNARDKRRTRKPDKG